MLRKQLRWSGLLVILISLLVNGATILIDTGFQNTAVQAVYGLGFTGLVLVCSLMHVAQSRRSGWLGSIAYPVTVLGLAYANVNNFLALAERAGISDARETYLGLSQALPVPHIAVFCAFVGFILLGISVIVAGVFPRWSGVLIAAGAALQNPAQIAVESLFLTVGGALLFGAGLTWTGWSLWSGKGLNMEEPGLSHPDRVWGGPVVILAGLLLGVDANVNLFGGLSLASGFTHLLSYTFSILAVFLIYGAFGERVSWTGFAGFVLAQVGIMLYFSTAFFIVAQLAGAINNNDMLMATWVEIPIGRVGQYSSILGLLLLSIETIHTESFHRWSGWLVLIGIALAFPFTFSVQDYFLGIFWVIGGTVEGIGVIWMGWTVLTTNRTVALPASQYNI